MSVQNFDTIYVFPTNRETLDPLHSDWVKSLSLQPNCSKTSKNKTKTTYKLVDVLLESGLASPLIVHVLRVRPRCVKVVPLLFWACQTTVFPSKKSWIQLENKSK